MKPETYERLGAIRDAHGPRELGKAAQKLLALAFHATGFGHIVERGVQGVDVDAARSEGGDRYAVEVKTTGTDLFAFEKKDAAGLAARARDGYLPVLACLKLSPLSDWLLVDARGLEPGRLGPERLLPYQLRDLQAQIRPAFDAALAQHWRGALERPQEYLDAALEKAGVEVRDE